MTYLKKKYHLYNLIQNISRSMKMLWNVLDVFIHFMKFINNKLPR